MNPRVGDVIFDTCSLSNFSAVDRLDLLEVRYGDRAAWTETIALEVRRGRPKAPYLQRVLDATWLGDPLEVGSSPAELKAIELLRRALGGESSKPMQHLGEAEIIYLVENRRPGSIFICDDRPAIDFARRRGIHVLDSSAVLADCYAFGEIGCPDAYNLLKDMADSDRGVFVPPHHRLVC